MKVYNELKEMIYLDFIFLFFYINYMFLNIKVISI